MTTIAWDGRTLATDSRTCTLDSHVALHRVSVKIRPIKGGWLAGCGNRLDVLALGTWIQDGRPENKRPAFRNEGSAAFFVDRQQRCWHLGSDLRDDDQPWPAKVAIGSGAELAWGAMHAGADALKAVRIACCFDTGSGLPVQWIDTVTGEEGLEQ